MTTYINYPALLIWQGDDELSYAPDSASLGRLSENLITEELIFVDHSRTDPKQPVSSD